MRYWAFAVICAAGLQPNITSAQATDHSEPIIAGLSFSPFHVVPDAGNSPVGNVQVLGPSNQPMTIIRERRHVGERRVAISPTVSMPVSSFDEARGEKNTPMAAGVVVGRRPSNFIWKSERVGERIIVIKPFSH